jgi:predicted metal-dependent phosphoesterase TrpH/ABC-type lipoprotein export system ATPase subunit
VIDLHAHSTASDGRLRPSALIALAAEAGLRVIGLTDHDTVAGLPEAREASQGVGIRLVNGIEVTAVEAGREVHVLGYFINPESPELDAFLQTQRASRIRRLEEMAARLRTLGCDIDVNSLLDDASRQGRSVGRPLLADALVAAGHAVSRRDAFDRLLGQNRPAFVPRSGAPVDHVTAVIRKAGGVASLAHPVRLAWDDRIPVFAAAGLGALEVRHRDHDADVEAHYRKLAHRLGLAVSGGSDFHGNSLEGRWPLGSVTLDEADFAALEGAANAAPRSAKPQTAPVLVFRDVQKNYHSLRPLRVRELTVAAGERVAVSGVDAGASEVLVNLVTGASLPDQGEIVVLGEATTGIRDGDAWFASLDRFGIVSERSPLLESATIEQNLAMPFTLRIDAIPPEVVTRVAALASECGIDTLDRRPGEVSPETRARVHLARAVALAPSLLIVEHAAAALPERSRADYADIIVRVTDRRRLAALILTEDQRFAARVAHRALKLQPATGELKPIRRGWFW